MLLDYRKQILDKAEVAGKEVHIDTVEEINEKINDKIKQGFNKYDVFDYYVDEMTKEQ